MNEEKLSKFEKVILDDSKAEAQSIIENAKAEEKQIIKNAKAKAKDIENQILKEGKSKIQKQYNFAISNSEFELKKELIEKRTQMTKSVFEKVLVKVNEFVSSEEYKVYLQKAVESATEKNSGTYYIEARGKDESLLKNLFPDVIIKTVNDISVGGVRVIFDNGILYDFTFDEKLSEQEKNFTNNKSLLID